MILEIILAYGSIPRGEETLIILSFAGARFKFPFRARQHPYFSTSLMISDFFNSLLIKTSTHSQVAAGEVIDLEKVFGITIPSEARSGTKIIVVSFPETPPIQYLLATIHGKRYISPVYAVAFVVYASSSGSDL